ncbi:MAG: outer membrane protein assembly factor BamB family protein [Planctomycetota bacterium]|jgi:outer membrane protein assembly factor BamB
MQRVGTFTIALGLVAVLARSEATAQDAAKYWPQWRGPLANGVAPEADPPVTWSEGQDVKWKVKCPGGGSATPIVWDDKVFVLAAVATDKPAPSKPAAGTERAASSPAGRPGQAPPGHGRGRVPGGGRGPGRRGGGMMRPFRPSVYYKFQVLCFDRETGKILWERTAREEFPHEGYRPGHGGYACYSPVTDGKNVYAYFGSRGLFCYDFDGNRKWERELGKMNIVMQFGEGGSPALCGDLLIVNRDHLGDSLILALNKHTGQTVWKADRDEPTSWSTPLVVEHQGITQAVVSAANRVRSYKVDTGEVIWECGGLTRNVIPSPVTDFGLVFVTSGYRGNSLQAIELGRKGDLTDSDAVKWHVDRGTPYVPSPLLYGDMLYVFSSNNAILSCYQARTGAAHFEQTRLEGLSGVYASPVGAADRVYLVSRDGKTMVIKRSKDLEVLATNTLDEGFDASPAVVDDQLFLRGREYLYCISGN